MLESDIERRLGERLRHLGCVYYKFVSPQQRGVPDRIVICPDGTVVFVELKRPGGHLATLQSVQQARLRKRGQRVAVVWTAADADAFVEWVLWKHCGQAETREMWRATDE